MYTVVSLSICYVIYEYVVRGCVLFSTHKKLTKETNRVITTLVIYSIRVEIVDAMYYAWPFRLSTGQGVFICCALTNIYYISVPSLVTVLK